MRKHVLSILFLVVAAGIWWVSFSPTLKNPIADNANPVVVTSGYVPYTLTKQLAGERVNMRMLLLPNAEPHAFEPTPGALISVKHADALVYVSDELEPWVKDVAKAAGAKTRVVALAEDFKDAQDPHVWMTVKNAQQMAVKIVQILTEVDPEHRAEYEANLTEFIQETDKLHAEFTRVLGACQQRDVVHIGHLAFGRLSEEYGLHLEALSGSSHDGEHSAKKVAQLVDLIRQKAIKTLFTEETISPRLAQTVADETHAQILHLYPVEHVSKQDFEANVTYTTLMRRNLDSLARGLVCKA